MAVTIAGINCEEVVHEYEEEFDVLGGPSARKTYLCPWANRFTVIHGILGLSSVPLPGGLITLNLPLPFPELAAESTNALASMYARNVLCKGVGPPIQGASNIAFTSAKLQVSFGNYPWTFQGIDYFQIDPVNPYIWIEQHMDFSGEFITVPGTQVYSSYNGKPISSNGSAQWGFYSPMIDVTLTLKNCPYLPAQQALTASGNPLNSEEYLGCAPGYLMFKGMQDDRTHAPDGTPTGNITIGFSFRSIAQWDCIYNALASSPGNYYIDGGDPAGECPAFWDQVLDGPSGDPVQGHSDLSQIIPAAYQA